MILVLQILITLVIVATTMPAILVAVPAAREGHIGQTVVLALTVLVFAVLRLAWPRRHRS